MSKTKRPRSIDEIVYPDSDGKPMADNTLQWEWIVTIKTNLDAMLPDDFVAGDLLWYPVKGEVKTRIAPDAMVCLGRPKGYRGSYKQWEEENVIPQVVFEVLSPGNTKKEMAEKLLFYEHHGVREYYLYDPDHNRLKGWQRGGEQLIEIAQMHNWVSPILGIRFDMSGKELVIFGKDGQQFLTALERHALIEQEHQRAEQEHQRAEHEYQRAEQAKERLVQAEQRAQLAEALIEQERKEKEAERLRNQRLSEKLKALGIDPEELD